MFLHPIFPRLNWLILCRKRSHFTSLELCMTKFRNLEKLHLVKICSQFLLLLQLPKRMMIKWLENNHRVLLVQIRDTFCIFWQTAQYFFAVKWKAFCFSGWALARQFSSCGRKSQEMKLVGKSVIGYK